MESSTEPVANWTQNQTLEFWKDCLEQLKTSSVIYGIIKSVIAVFGILGQITAVIVLVQPSMRSSTSILLVVMAVYDILFLTIALFYYVQLTDLVIKRLGFGYVISPILFKYLILVHFNALTGTVYMTVLVTIERAVVVVFPLQAKRLCTMARAGIASLVVLAWTVVYNIPLYMVDSFGSDYTSNQTEHNNHIQDFASSHFFLVVYQVHINSVFHLFLPVGVIIILNIVIIQRLYRRGRSTIGLASSSGDNQKQLTTMIVALTAIFCAGRLVYILNLYYYLTATTDKTNAVTHGSTCNLTNLIILHLAEMATILNSSNNFIVYSIFGRKFRRCLRKLCCCT